MHCDGVAHGFDPGLAASTLASHFKKIHLATYCELRLISIESISLHDGTLAKSTRCSVLK